MKKLLNTLYVMSQGMYLSKEGETIVAQLDHKVLQRIPIHTISGLVCFGNVTCSPFLFGLCSQKDVAVSFLTENGRFLAHVQGSVSGNVLLRMAQFRATQSQQETLSLARSFVTGKIINARSVLQRKSRDHGEIAEVQQVVDFLADCVKKARCADTIDSLRGIEGIAANEYFSIFNHMLVAQVDDFSIQSRNRRPPMDPMNALLSFLYTLLAHDCQGALESVGLDPQVGFLHALRPGRPSLALDLMEEFRSLFVDRMVLSLVNLRQVQVDDFIFHENGAVEMKEDTRKMVLSVWQKKKTEELTHPFINEKIQLGLFPYVQASLLARHLRGDLDAYPPCLMK